MDAQIQGAIRKYLITHDPHDAERVVQHLIRSGQYQSKEPSRAWGTVAFDPENPPLTANDLYMLKPATVVTDFEYRSLGLQRYVNEISMYDVPEEEITLIAKHEYIDGHFHYIDDRRYIALTGIFFDGEPVMLIQEAGREGDDDGGFWITHPANYARMIEYLFNLIPPPDEEDREDTLLDPDRETDTIFRFYGRDARDLIAEQLGM